MSPIVIQALAVIGLLTIATVVVLCALSLYLSARRQVAQESLDPALAAMAHLQEEAARAVEELQEVTDSGKED